LEGDTLWTKSHVDTVYQEFCQTMINSTDGNYIITSTPTKIYSSTPEREGDACLTKINEEGEIIWKIQYGTDTLREVSQDVLLTYDNGFVLTGQKSVIPGDNADVYAVRTDSMGNKLWERQYGGADFEAGSSIIQTPDSGFLILGWTRSFGNGERDFYLVKIDSIGNEQWYETYGTFRDELGNSIILLSDGNYLLTGSGSQSSGVGSQGKIYKITSEGNLIWSKNYIYDSNSGNNLHKTFELENGDLVSVGMTHGSSDAGYLIKTNSLGEVIWQREYDYDDNTDLFYTMLPTSDGGFLLGGQAKHEFPLTQDAWLLKVDSMGCTYPNCTVGIEEENKKVLVDVYPNPTNEILNIELQENKDYHLTIADLQGKIIYQTTLTRQKSTVNVSGFADGIYLLTLQNEEQRTTVKVVVQH
jgi:hypothetical protein